MRKLPPRLGFQHQQDCNDHGYRYLFGISRFKAMPTPQGTKLFTYKKDLSSMNP